METVYAAEREEQQSTALNGTPPSMTSAAKKAVKKGVMPTRRKVKGQAKVRRRTTNPKKVKKNERMSTARDVDSLSDKEEEIQALGTKEATPSMRGQIQGRVSGSSDEEESSGGEGGGGKEDEEEEEEWDRLQQSLHKHSKKKFEQKATDSHPVHAPFFPEVCKSRV